MTTGRGMRYAEGGGLTAAERAKREQVRFAAVDRFAHGESVAQVARQLRVTKMSANRWRKAWREGGRAALRSKGAGGAVCKLDQAQLGALVGVLAAGPAAAGWADQRWTLARVVEVIRARFRVGYTLSGVHALLHRLGFTVQVPARRAAQRDEAAVATWRQEQWPVVKAPRRT